MGQRVRTDTKVAVGAMPPLGHSVALLSGVFPGNLQMALDAGSTRNTACKAAR